MRSFAADEWTRVRARGKNAFLVRYGVLGRGVPIGAICAVAIEVALGNRFPEALGGGLFLLRLVALSALFSVSGCLRANVTWNQQEKRYASRG